jgi:hypothetical protein
VDLILFAFAIGSGTLELAGIILLHLSFLFYLEYTHKHPNRLHAPKIIWILFGIAGIILYPKISVIGYVISSVLYTGKNSRKIAPFAPFCRGLQYYFLAAGIMGFLNPVSFLAFVLLTIRNFTGDLRDVIKDKKEKTKTLPIIIGFKHSQKYIHISTLFFTSFVWWYISGISIIWLVLTYLIQIGTYNLTPR